MHATNTRREDEEKLEKKISSCSQQKTTIFFPLQLFFFIVSTKDSKNFFLKVLVGCLMSRLLDRVSLWLYDYCLLSFHTSNPCDRNMLLSLLSFQAICTYCTVLKINRKNMKRRTRNEWRRRTNLNSFHI